MNNKTVIDFKQQAIWTQTLHQIIVQGLNAADKEVQNATPINAELSYKICNILGRMIVEGFNQQHLWEELCAVSQFASNLFTHDELAAEAARRLQEQEGQ